MTLTEMYDAHAELDKQIAELRERQGMLHEAITRVENNESHANAGPPHLAQGIG